MLAQPITTVNSATENDEEPSFTEDRLELYFRTGTPADLVDRGPGEAPIGREDSPIA